MQYRPSYTKRAAGDPPIAQVHRAADSTNAPPGVDTCWVGRVVPADAVGSSIWILRLRTGGRRPR